MSTAPASLLTAAEAAQRLGANGKQRLQDLIREGQLRAFKFPDGALGFNTADLETLLRPVPVEEALAILEGQEPGSPTPSSTPLPTVHALFQRLEQMVQRLASNPKWATAARIHDLYGVDRRRLAELVGRGLVKRAKLGEAQQAQTVYRVEDLDRYLEGVAAGKLEP